MKILVTAAFAAILGSVSFANPVTDPNDARSWQGATVGTFANLIYGSDTLANRQQIIADELLDDSIFNTSGFSPASLVRGAGATGRSLDLTGTGSFDYVLEGSDPALYANDIDDKWFQSGASAGQTVFDLGAPSSFCAVFPVIDHGPLPQEAIESTVYLSNTPDDVNSWVQAKFVKVFLEGFQPNKGILWDGFSYVVTTPDKSLFRYASIIHGGPGALHDDGDDEINGLLGLRAVPEPSSIIALGAGVALLARRRRK